MRCICRINEERWDQSAEHYYLLIVWISDESIRELINKLNRKFSYHIFAVIDSYSWRIIISIHVL